MTPLVLLPGMMCDARLFSPQIGALSGRYPIFVAPIGAHDTMQALAAEVLRHAPDRFALAGLSMGGIVAMEMLRQAPGRLAGMALMDTNPLAEADQVKARREPQIEAVKNGRLRDVMAEEIQEGRDLYQSRVAPELLGRNLYDRAIIDLLVRSKAHVESAMW